VHLIVCSLLSIIFFVCSYILTSQKGDSEKLSAYECGFDPFDDARNTFDVRFYLVAILFIIFDLEISFLFPWCIVLCSLPYFAYWSMFLFLSILTIGFIYEWKKGALEWE
jgi:NADH-quinone oxidoreductase subunit A